jgi:hypothetical protein
MMRKTLAILALQCALFCFSPYALSQDEPAKPTPQAGESEKKDDNGDSDVEPPGTGKRSLFGDMLAAHWSLSTAFQSTQTFDDNVFLANSFRKSDTVTRIAGRITAAYRGKHTRFEANYLPEYNIYQRYEPLNFSSHAYMQTFSHSFSPRLEFRWGLNVRQMPSRGNLPFATINFGGFAYSYYSLDALADGVNIFNSSTDTGVSYRLNQRNTVSADFQGAVTRFTERGNPTTPVISTEITYSTGLRLGWEYKFNPRQSFGVHVSSTYFGFVNPANHQHHQSVQADFTQRFARGYQLNLSAGPGFTRRQGSNKLQTSAYFNVGLSKHMQRSSIAANFRRSTQVGLLQHSVSAYAGSLHVNRSFGRKWVGNLGGSYTRSSDATGASQLEGISGSGHIGYRMTSHLTTYANYGYTHQQTLILNAAGRNVDRNEVAVGFVYNFGVVAGR